MKSKFIFFILIISISSFIWGVGVGIYKWFPYFYLQEAKQIFNPSIKKDVIENVSIDNTYIRKHAESIKEYPVWLKRKELIKKIIYNKNFLNTSKERINDNSDKITSKIYNNEINGILTYAPKPKNV